MVDIEDVGVAWMDDIVEEDEARVVNIGVVVEIGVGVEVVLNSSVTSISASSLLGSYKCSTSISAIQIAQTCETF